MKKNCLNPDQKIYSFWSGKTFRIMKISVFLFFVGILGIYAGNSYSQTKLLSLDLRETTVGEVLDNIEDQSEFYFLYSNKLVDANRKVSLKVKSQPVSNILDHMFADTDVRYMVFDRQIILSPERILEKTIKQQNVQPQGQEITGTVTDEDGNPLPGATIVVKGTSTGVITDANGHYSIEVDDPDATLVFSYIGYREISVKIQAREEINVTMEITVTALEEVVAIGYGTQKKVNLTGAVATVNARDLQDVNVVNSTSLLEGQLSGLITKQTSGQPGLDGASLSIRGYGTPLILVDGVERGLNKVESSMIESISVLKDASAAIYGARAGNGVILITTKRGALKQDFQFNYNGSYSLQQFTNIPGLVTNSGEYTEAWVEAEENVGLPPTFSDEEIQKYYAGEENYGSYDWFDYVFRDYAPRQKHNLSVRGGGDKVAYFAGVGINDQMGMFESKDWWYKQYNIRSNADALITDNFTASLDLNYIYGHRSNTFSQWAWVYKAQPMVAPFPDIPLTTEIVPATNTYGTHQRLVANLYKDLKGGYDLISNDFLGKFTLEYDFPFLEGLSTDISFDYRLYNFRNKEIQRQSKFYRKDPNTGELILDAIAPASIINNLLGYTDHKYTRLKPTIELQYSQNFGDHSVEGLLVGEYISDNRNEIYAETQNLLSTDLMYFFLGDQTYNIIDQGVEEYARESLAGRFQYSYQGRYLFEGTFRYDASSYFPADSRWGFFPSISAGWRISEEPFMQQIPWLYNMKLRASYSQTGYDQNTIPYDYFTGYNVYTDPPYIFGNSGYRRIQQGSLANTAMTWEKITNYNVGLDVTFWDGKLTTLLEGFYRERSDILAIPQLSFPSTFGALMPQQNLNSLSDRGFELEVIHNNQLGEFIYTIRGNITYARAKWIHYEEEEYDTEAEQRIYQNSGKWRNRAIGYVSDGLFRSQAEIDNSPVDQDQMGNVTIRPGYIKYKDLNGDGTITWEDQERIGYGTGQPDLDFGLNFNVEYKNVKLGVVLHGASMFAGYVHGLAQDPFKNQSTPIELYLDERFHSEKNPEGSLPLMTFGETAHNLKYSDFWLKNIFFLRLENVRLSYTIPKNLISPLGVENLDVYITANNLAVIDNLGIWSSEFDPEAPMTHSHYPPTRIISMGVNLTF